MSGSCQFSRKSVIMIIFLNIAIKVMASQTGCTLVIFRQNEVTGISTETSCATATLRGTALRPRRSTILKWRSPQQLFGSPTIISFFDNFGGSGADLAGLGSGFRCEKFFHPQFIIIKWATVYNIKLGSIKMAITRKQKKKYDKRRYIK